MMTIFRRPRGSGEAFSWIRKNLVILVEGSVCDTKTFSTNAHSLQSVKS